MSIQWGPDIATCGQRPAWITDQDKMSNQNGIGQWQYPKGSDAPNSTWSWEHIPAIRLPADHFAYKAIAAGLEPWAGGKDAPHDWDRGPVLLGCGRWVSGILYWNRDESDEDIIGYRKKEKTMTDTAPEAPNTDAMPTPDAIARELSIAQAQRNALGQIAAHWIGRFFALKAAGGDIPPANVVPSTEAALREVDAMMQQLAASGE